MYFYYLRGVSCRGSLSTDKEICQINDRGGEVPRLLSVAKIGKTWANLAVYIAHGFVSRISDKLDNKPLWLDGRTFIFGGDYDHMMPLRGTRILARVGEFTLI
jgi:hypothetical protein